MLTRLSSAVGLAACLLLCACGGGDDDDVVRPPPAPPLATAVPDSAIVSSTAFVSYLNGQSFSDETSEALTLPAGDVATSETEEPVTI